MQYWLQLYVYRTQQTQGGPSVDCTDPVIKKSHWNCYTNPIRVLQSIHSPMCLNVSSNPAPQPMASIPSR